MLTAELGALDRRYQLSRGFSHPPPISACIGQVLFNFPITGLTSKMQIL